MRYFEDLQIGVPVVLGPYELLEEEIISYAKKWDPQPFHIDPEIAAHSPMKGLTASSTHTYAIIGLLNSMKEPIASIASVKHEIEIPAPARPGDLLSVTLTFVDKRLSKSKPDRGLVTFMYVLKNQKGQELMRLKSLILVHCRSAAE
jgi:acyl dehydratase